MIRVLNDIEKLRFQNVFSPHDNAKQAFSNSSGLKSVLKKFRYPIGVDSRPNRRNKTAF